MTTPLPDFCSSTEVHVYVPKAAGPVRKGAWYLHV